MDCMKVGKLILQLRTEKGLTQKQVADQLNISNKTISKWETGKCMPDYSVIELLCKELEITVAELLDGEEKTDKSVRVYDDTQILELLKRTQNLENQRTSLYGMILIIIGLAFLAIHFNIGGSNIRDFVSGVLLGLSIFEMLVGLYILSRGLGRQKKY